MEIGSIVSTFAHRHRCSLLTTRPNNSLYRCFRRQLLFYLPMKRSSAFTVRVLPRQSLRNSASTVVMGHEATDTAPSSNATLWARLNLSTRVLKSAWMHEPQADLITAVWSRRNPIAGKKGFFQTSHMLLKTRSISTPMTELASSEAANFYYSHTRSRSLRFVHRPSGEPGLLAELWSSDGIQFSWVIPESVHGPVYASDEWFAPMAWSPDEKLVAYIADAPDPKVDSSSDSERDDPSASWSYPLNHKFHANSRGPFGETYSKCRSPALFIAEVDTGTVSVAAHPPEWHLAQPQWTRTGWLICSARRTGSESKSISPAFPDDLGVRYCYNRLCVLVAMRAPENMSEIDRVAESLILLTDPEEALDFCCVSPRASPCGHDLVYISAPGGTEDRVNAAALPHNRAKILRYIRITDGGFSKPTTLLDAPHSPTWNEFPGLFVHGLPERAWVSNDTVALTTTWHSSDRVVSFTFPRSEGVLSSSRTLSDIISVDSVGTVADKNGNGGVDESLALDTCSATLLDVHEGKFLVSISDMATPPRLAVVHNNQLKWVSEISRKGHQVASPVKKTISATLVANGLDDGRENALQMKAKEFDPRVDHATSAFQVTVVLSQLQNTQKSGLVVFPHGGPHTASVRGFSVATQALLIRGFAVLFVNYRGSTGFGQASLETLLGRVGTQDVVEVVQSTRWALAKDEFGIDTDKVVFIGGSHSGFLGAHVSLVPDLFKRTVLRNPVVNISTMVGATDIPDWCFAEAGLLDNGEGAFVANADALKEMYEKSPVYRVPAAKETNVYPKTLLQVGGSDKRVPPTQSLEWRRLLTSAFGEDVVTMRWYESAGHSIDQVPEGDDAWVHALDFVCEVL